MQARPPLPLPSITIAIFSNIYIMEDVIGRGSRGVTDQTKPTGHWTCVVKEDGCLAQILEKYRRPAEELGGAKAPRQTLRSWRYFV